MTIETTVRCDGYGCSRTLNVDDCDTEEIAMEHAGWHEDPNCGWQHYCNQCWPEVEKELADEEE